MKRFGWFGSRNGTRQSVGRHISHGTLAQLLSLAQRTDALIDDYAARRDMADGQALHLITSFREGLAGVARSTQADAARARSIADIKLLHLSEAERRRQAVEDRASAESKALASQGQQAPLSARKALGTKLE